MIRSRIPNTITLLNLFCGCLALISIFTGQIEWLPLFVTVSLITDYIDGLVARLLKVSSDLGRELDSLADMISFGAVPGAMFYYMINQTYGNKQVLFTDSSTYISLIGFVITIFSCLRLAKFNLDTRQTEGFVGLNTPACTIFSVGVLMVYLNPSDMYGLHCIVKHPAFVTITPFIMSYLLIAEVPMFSFKFNNLNLRENIHRYLFILLCVLYIFLLPNGLGYSMIILSYIFISIVLWLVGWLKREKREY